MLGPQGIEESPVCVNQSPFSRLGKLPRHHRASSFLKLHCFAGICDVLQFDRGMSPTGSRLDFRSPDGCCIDEVDALGVRTSLENGDWRPLEQAFQVRPLYAAGPAMWEGTQVHKHPTATELLWPSLP